MRLRARLEKLFSMSLVGLGTSCPADKENFFESRNYLQEPEKIPRLGKLMSWCRLGGKINWTRLVQAVEEQNGAPQDITR
jgi:hypothetical protein